MGAARSRSDLALAACWPVGPACSTCCMAAATARGSLRTIFSAMVNSRLGGVVLQSRLVQVRGGQRQRPGRRDADQHRQDKLLLIVAPGRPQGLFAHGQAAVGRKVHLPRQADIAAQGPRFELVGGKGLGQVQQHRRGLDARPIAQGPHRGILDLRIGAAGVGRNDPSDLAPPTRPIHSITVAAVRDGRAIQQARPTVLYTHRDRRSSNRRPGGLP